MSVTEEQTTVNNILQSKNIIIENAINVDITDPDEKLVIKMWDLFRLTDPQCIEKLPNNEHIKERNPELPIVDEKLYKDVTVLFRILINMSGNRALFIKFIKNDCTDTIIYFCEDNISIFQITIENEINIPFRGIYYKIVVDL